MRDEKGKEFKFNKIINLRYINTIYKNERKRKTDPNLKLCSNYNDVVEQNKDQIMCTIFKKKRIRK